MQKETLDMRMNPPFSSRAQRGGAALRVIGFTLLFVVALSGTALLQSARLKEVQLNPPYIDDMFLPRKEYIKTLAFGYDMFAADFLYIRAIQAFGANSKVAQQHPDGVFNFFDTITELDPHFIEAYEFGSLVLGDGGYPEAGIRLNSKGWNRNRDRYRMPFLNAYAANWTMQRPELAKVWVKKALTAPDVPDWLERWVGYLDRESGRFEAAFEPRLRDYLATLDDTALLHEREISGRHLRIVTHEWNLRTLNQALLKYMQDHSPEGAGDTQPFEKSAYPGSLQDMVDAGYLNDYRGSDFPTVTAILEHGIAEQMLAQIRQKQKGARFVDLIEPVLSLCVKELSGIPDSPYKTAKEDDFYFLRADLTPKDYIDAIGGDVAVWSKHDAKEYMTSSGSPLMWVRAVVKKFHEDNGRFPDPLEEASPDGIVGLDPVTGTWDYDPTTGEVKSPTYPDL
jgi:hypothetical protein